MVFCLVLPIYQLIVEAGLLVPVVHVSIINSPCVTLTTSPVVKALDPALMVTSDT